MVEGFTAELDLQLKKLDQEWIEIDKEIQSWKETPSALGISEGKLFFDICDEGYVVPSSDELVKKYIGEELKVPRVSMLIHIPQL